MGLLGAVCGKHSAQDAGSHVAQTRQRTGRLAPTHLCDVAHHARLAQIHSRVAAVMPVIQLQIREGKPRQPRRLVTASGSCGPLLT